MKSKKSTRRRRIVATQKNKSKSGKRHVSRKIRKSRSVRGGQISTGALVGTTALVGTGAYITYQQYQKYQQNRKRTEITRALDAFNKLTLDTLVDVIETFKDFLHDAQSIINLIRYNFETFKTLLRPDDFMLYPFKSNYFNLDSLLVETTQQLCPYNIKYLMVVWFIEDCSFTTWQIVKNIEFKNISPISNKIIRVVNLSRQDYLTSIKDNSTSEEAFKTIYSNMYGAEKRLFDKKTIQEEAKMLFTQYQEYFKNNLQKNVCFRL